MTVGQGFDQPFFPGEGAASNSAFGNNLDNTETTLLAAPAADRYRVVFNLTINNRDVGSHDVAIGINDGTTTFRMDFVTLAANESYHAQRGVGTVAVSATWAPRRIIPLVLKPPNDTLVAQVIGAAPGTDLDWTVHWGEPT